MAPTVEQAKAKRAKQLAGQQGGSTKARVARYLKKSTESTVMEGAKSVLLLKGIRCSHAMGIVLKDLRAMLQPHCKLLSKKNAIVPFDDHSPVEGGGGQQSLEFLCVKNDCSLFAMASSNKKRPNNLVLGRLFDHHILDMIEIGIQRYKSLLLNYGGSVPKKRVGSKPCMLFVGDLWDDKQRSEYSKLQNLLIDFYKGDPVNKLVASGLDHIMVFTIVDGTAGGGGSGPPMIHQRTYYMKLKKNPNDNNNNNDDGGNSNKVPLPFLTPCGPDMDFTIRRSQLASPDLWKASLRQPQQRSKKRKAAKKNQSTNLFGETIGRLHLERQDIGQAIGRKSKALRRAEKEEKEAEQQLLEEELAGEKEHLGAEFKQQYGFDENEDDNDDDADQRSRSAKKKKTRR